MLDQNLTSCSKSFANSALLDSYLKPTYETTADHHTPVSPDMIMVLLHCGTTCCPTTTSHSHSSFLSYFSKSSLLFDSVLRILVHINEKGAEYMVMINKTSSKPYYEQLILSIKEDILHGVLRPSDQIPSVREMAKRLLMNPNTVSKAYNKISRK